MKCIISTFVILLLVSVSIKAQKREFRAAWIATVANIDWPSQPGLTTEQQKAELRALLDQLEYSGMNAVIGQVRPASDAFYPSSLESWSEWLTGEKGKAPSPYYDPLMYMIDEAHDRALEFHAWFNPYRALFKLDTFYMETREALTDSIRAELDSTSVGPDSSTVDYQLIAAASESVDSVIITQDSIIKRRMYFVEDTTHLTVRQPEWFVTYGGKMYFDPGIPEAREFVVEVIEDVVRRYDLDGVHFDDYFYPYRIAGKEFPDSVSFKKYGGKYYPDRKDDWRRENVNTIIKMLHDSIKAIKPHVKFGISPFGVWRNKSDDPRGSDTRAGQTNYDDLYADVLLWMENEWLDYILPQIYWYMDFAPADYNVLSRWWNDHHYGRHVYIGEGAYRVNPKSPNEAWQHPSELHNHVRLSRGLEHIDGNAYFSAKSIVQNPLGIRDTFHNKLYEHKALVPTMPWIDAETPEAPVHLTVSNQTDGVLLEWNEPEDTPYYFVVYRSESEDMQLDETEIIDIIRYSDGIYLDKTALHRKKYNYAVSALDRLWNESEAAYSSQIKYKDPDRGFWFFK